VTRGLSSAPTTPTGDLLARLTLDTRLSSLPAMSSTHRTRYTSYPTPMMKAAPVKWINTNTMMNWSLMLSCKTTEETEWSWTLCWVHRVGMMMDALMVGQRGPLQMVPGPGQYRQQPPSSARASPTPSSPPERTLSRSPTPTSPAVLAVLDEM
jgi:hypothetical protein